MLRLRRALACVTLATTFVTAASAQNLAAQPGGPCGLIADDMLSQVLGSPHHAFSFMAPGNGGGAAGSGPAIADLCFVPLGGASSNAIVISHTTGAQTPGDANATLALTQNAAGALGAGGAFVDPAVTTTTPISGIGDDAVLISASGDQEYDNLIVWRGSDGYSLMASALPDAQTTLMNLAQSILASQPAP